MLIQVTAVFQVSFEPTLQLPATKIAAWECFRQTPIRIFQC